MANEFKHKDVGDEITKAEYHAVDGHEADSQAAGDLIYCDGTYWKRLGKGANGLYLKAGSVPYWEAILEADIPASIARDAEVDSKISDHADVESAHHTKFTNTEHDVVARHPLANLDPDVCSEAEADSKVSTHAALTTGVHGVGANYLAKSSVDALDLAAHYDRHSLLADDRVKVLLNLINCTMALTDWTTRDAWTNYVTGSGSISWGGILQMEAWTHATNGSIASLYTGIMGGFSPHSLNYPWGVRIQPCTVMTTCEFWAVARRGGATSFPSTTESHIGWRLLNGNLYASNGNGAAGTQTDTGIDLGQYKSAELLIVGDRGTEAKFYCNRVLVATHTTNLPVQWSYLCWLGGKNTAAANRGVRIMKTVWGVEY